MKDLSARIGPEQWLGGPNPKASHTDQSRPGYKEDVENLTEQFNFSWEAENSAFGPEMLIDVICIEWSFNQISQVRGFLQTLLNH